MCIQTLPMFPFSMARISGLSLQSVLGITALISSSSSFSCMANDVKLYICSRKGKRKTQILVSSSEPPGCNNIMKNEQMCMQVCVQGAERPEWSWLVVVRFSRVSGCLESPPKSHCLVVGFHQTPRWTPAGGK